MDSIAGDINMDSIAGEINILEFCIWCGGQEKYMEYISNKSIMTLYTLNFNKLGANVFPMTVQNEQFTEWL